MNRWGESFYDHFCSYLGEPTGREIFRVADDAPSIQILTFKKVFPECDVLCSLGFSQYSENQSVIAEVILVTDLATEASSKVFANTLFFLIDRRIRIGRGVAVGGVDTIDAGFAAQYQKAAVYFTSPYVFPGGFGELAMRGNAPAGKVYWAFFLSQAEYVFFKKYGADKLEALFEEKKVDPFSLQRGSVV